MLNFKDLSTMSYEDINKEYLFLALNSKALYKGDVQVFRRIKDIEEYINLRKHIKIKKEETK